MRLRAGVPIWLSHAPARQRRYPTLAGRQHADVVIVGGGMTGAGIALACAEAGQRVALVEAALVGRGSTAASTALLLQETDADLRSLTRRYGRKRAVRIWELSREATGDLIATIKRLKIPCDLEQQDTLYYTMKPGGATALRDECRRRQQHGFSAAWLDPTDLLAATGIEGGGAIRSKGNAQFDPYRACLGLLQAAARTGARIFEKSRVTRIDVERARVTVRTAKGAIAADRVVIATGYATPAFRPLTGRFRMKQTYVLATAPLDRRQRARLGLADVMLWDTERPYHYVRWTRDGRLLLGGGDHPAVSHGRHARAFAASTRRLREDFDAILPGLEGIEIERAWEGLFAMSPDGLPYIGPHRRYPRHLFALGYGGNGMTFGFLAARLLLDAYGNVTNPDLELFAFNRLR